MKRKVGHFKLGLFVILGVGLAIGGLIWIGAVRFLHGGTTYVAFFDSSVGDLSSGSAVDYRGVKVGTVDSVGVAPDERLVRVELTVESDFHVRPTMVAEVAPSGLTGGSNLSLVETGTPQHAKAPGFEVHHAILPTRKGSGGITGTIQTIAAKIDTLDLDGLLAAWKKPAEDAHALLTKGDVPAILDRVSRTAADVQKTAADLRREDLGGRIAKTVASLDAVLASARRTVDAANAQIEDLPPHALGELALHIDGVAAAVAATSHAIHDRVDAISVRVENDAAELDRLLTDLQALARSLREEPGRILKRPKSSEPFGEKK